jgi:hypothetical protein
MKTFIPARLRAPTIMVIGGAAVVITVGTVHGWSSSASAVPVVILAAIGYYLWAGRDSDTGAVIRHQADERQAALRVKAQALVGQVMSLAAVVTYLIAVAAKATLWPFAILVCLPAATFAAGWLIYRDHGQRPSAAAHE